MQSINLSIKTKVNNMSSFKFMITECRNALEKEFFFFMNLPEPAVDKAKPPVQEAKLAVKPFWSALDHFQKNILLLNDKS